MAKKPNINELMDNVFMIREMLTEVVETALEVANDAEGFGGEISRVITGQVRQTLVPGIQKFIDGTNAGSISSLIEFLDSVPLAWVRQQANDTKTVSTGANMLGSNSQASSGVRMPPEPEAPTEANELAAIGVGQRESTDPMSKILNKLTGKVDFNRLEEKWNTADKQDLSWGAVRESVDPGSIRPDLHPYQAEGTIYNQYAEASNDKLSTQKRIKEADMLAGPYKMEQPNLEGYGDWRTLVESSGDIEGLGAEDMAAVFGKMEG